MKKLRCFLVLTCILATIPAYAESDLTIFGAVHHEGKLTVATAQTAASTSANFNPGNFGAFGIRYGSGKVIGQEQTIAYAPNFLEANTKAIIYNGDLLVQAPLPKVKPYATAGLGWVFSYGSDDSGRPSFAKIGSKFALNYGGGLKILPAGPVGIRFDVRGYFIPSVKFNVVAPSLSDPNGTIKSLNQNLNMLEAGLGIIFAFGK